MTLETKQLIGGSSFVTLAALIAVLTPIAYQSWAIGPLVIGMHTLWTVRKRV